MELKQILQVLKKAATAKGVSKPFIVGGLPRDKLLGRLTDVNDIDLTTGDETIHNYAKIVAELLKGMGEDVYLKTLKDGHRQIQLSNIKLDFSSSFYSKYSKPLLERAGIKHPSSMQMEMFSRDFTCNALLMSLDDLSISDPTGMGVADIKRKLLRTPLPPNITLNDSHKRIIRTIYLACKLGFTVEEPVIKWIQKNQAFLKDVSPKYIEDYLHKAIKYDSEKATLLLRETGLIRSPMVSLGSKKKRNRNKRRVDLDVRPHGPLFKNYDYTEEGPNETSPGGGLYHGKMDKYKSVKDFVEKRRKENKKIRKQALAKILIGNYAE